MAMIALEVATSQFERAAFTAAGWEQALQSLALAAGAEGATIPCNDATGASIAIISTDSVADAVRDYIAGRSPPDPRSSRVQLDTGSGFALDLDHFRPEELARDPFYNEFLRPIGFGWHAVARLDDGTGQELCLSLKRRRHLGPFPEDVRRNLDLILPRLRQASLVARALAGAEPGASAEGAFLLHLDHGGGVARIAQGEAAFHHSGARLRGRRLVLPLPAEQHRLDEAIATVCRRSATVECALFHDCQGTRHLLRLMPVTVATREIFGGIRAVAVGHRIVPRPDPDEAVARLLLAFGITAAEARVGAYLAAGWPAESISRRLGVSHGTVRNQIKAVLAKTGTVRQAEFVALVLPLRR